MVEYSNITVEIADHVGLVKVDRPDKLNALNNDTILELTAAWTAMSDADDVGVIVFTGTGEKAFIAGADIAMLADQDVVSGRENSRLGQRLTTTISGSAKPSIAAINGWALGGGLEMALACDLRYASSKARMGLPEVSLGILPGYGGTQRLPRIVGAGNALLMILSGDPITADVALRMGLVSDVFEPDVLIEGVMAIAKTVLSRGPTALAMAKQAVYRGLELPIEEGLRVEADLFGVISSTDEMKEGMAAFLEKRAPSWKR